MLPVIDQSDLREPNGMKHTNLDASVRWNRGGGLFTWINGAFVYATFVISEKGLVEGTPLVNGCHLRLSDYLELLSSVNDRFSVCVFDMLSVNQQS